MTARDLRIAAAKLGATVECDHSIGDRWDVYQVIAPEGSRWVDGGVHSLRVEWDNGQRPAWKQMRDEAIADAISRMEEGLKDCADDCECRE